MTDAVALPAADRDAIAGKMAARLGEAELTSEADADLELGEAFPLHILRSPAVAGRGRVRRLGRRIEPARLTHLQIRRRGTAILAAHARRDEQGWQVTNLFGALLAPKIEHAIAWVDRHLPEPGQARLLLVPESQVVAFWIEQPRRDRIVLISGEGKHQRLSTARAYSVHRFLRALFGDYAAARPAATRPRSPRP